MSLAGDNKWTLSSRIFTSMVSVGAPGMANSTISLWFSASAYATVSGATFIRTTCILIPSSLIDNVQIRRDCLFRWLTASRSRQQLANRPDVIGELGFHCRRDAQGLMHAAEVIPRHEDGDSCFLVIEFLAETVGQAREPSQVHPDSEIRPFDVRRRNPAHLRVATDRCGDGRRNVRRRAEPVRAVRSRLSVLLDELREVHVSAEVFFHGIGVAFQAIRGELRSMLFGDPLAQVPYELVGAHGVPLADVVAEDGLRLAVERDPDALITTLNRIVHLETLLCFLDEGPDCVGLDAARSDVLDLRVEQSRAACADR